MADDKQKAAAKAAKKEERAAKRAKRKQTRGQIWQAFNMLRKEDKALIPILLLTVIGVALVFFLIGSLWGGHWFMLIIGLLFGITAAFWVFSRRLERNMYHRIDGEPGAAAWAIDNLKSNFATTWVTETGIAATTQMDVVHRVVGHPGVIFVGEGNPNRLKPLMNQHKKRADRVLGGVPIYEVIIGNDEGQVPLRKLQNHLVKLPRNFKKDEVYSIAAKVEALANVRGGNMAGLPKGPMPKQAQNMAGMNRRMRRASQRSQRRSR